jgi:hypothetical protein
VVRTGPNHLHIRDANAVSVVLAPRSQWRKHEGASLDCIRLYNADLPAYFPGYEVPVPPGHDDARSVLMTIDPVEHTKRRRVWNRAFTPSALQNYQPLLAAQLSQLIACLDAREGQVIDIAEWFGFFALDFMGQFALSGEFNFMECGTDTGDFHKTLSVSRSNLEWIQPFMQAGQTAMGLSDLTAKIPWCRPLVHLVPNPLAKLIATSLSVAQQRKASSPSRIKDLFYYLVCACVKVPFLLLNHPPSCPKTNWTLVLFLLPMFQHLDWLKMPWSPLLPVPTRLPPRWPTRSTSC